MTIYVCISVFEFLGTVGQGTCVPLAAGINQYTLLLILNVFAFYLRVKLGCLCSSFSSWIFLCSRSSRGHDTRVGLWNRSGAGVATKGWVGGPLPSTAPGALVVVVVATISICICFCFCLYLYFLYLYLWVVVVCIWWATKGSNGTSEEWLVLKFSSEKLKKKQFS